MLETSHKRYCATYEALNTDEEYLFLQARLQDHAPQFASLMERLSQEDKDIITEHLGLCAELHERAIEIACFLP